MGKSYYRYAERVGSGEQVACKWIRLAVERFYLFLERPDLEFREEEVDRVIGFIGLLKHYKNKHAGKPFRLEPWQCFIVACVFGFFRRGTGDRLCQSVYIEMSRKNGKTAFASALALYLLIADGVNGAEVDLAANSKEQAKIAFEFASKFAIGLNTSKTKHLHAYRDKILYPRTDSKVHVFAADASKLDGFGASAYILDEYHEARDTKLRDVLQSSQADRDKPLGIIITTAGFNKLGVCYNERTICTDVLAGLTQDDALWAFIYTLDEGDDWSDESVWGKCSPNLGVTVRPSFLAAEIQRAKNDPSKEVGIRTKTFNIWCDSVDVWVPDNYIIQAMHDEPLSDYAQREADCYVGVDLSATSDLTCVAYLCPSADGRIRFWVDYYLPQEALDTKPQKELYKQWYKQGYLKLTPGNVVDYDMILADILANRQAGLYYHGVAYDSWNATQFAINATGKYLPMQSFGQNIGNFNRPTKELERLLLGGKVLIHNNPITRFCFRNVSLRTDMNGNQKPDKSRSDNKIDGVIAMLEALGYYLTVLPPDEDFSI